MILLFVINVLLIYGIKTATDHGMILEPIRIGYEIRFKFLGKYQAILAKALFDCTPCMSSIYGTFFFFITDASLLGFQFFPIWVLCICGFNGLLNKALK